MLRLLIVTQESRVRSELSKGLVRNGLACSVIPYSEGAITRQSPDIILIEIDNTMPTDIIRLISRTKRERYLPVIALVYTEKLDSVNGHLGIADDFITSPYDTRELVLRINRLHDSRKHKESKELIRCEDLVIDLAECEVTVAGRVVELTFKEYELLKLLASHRGRVYTRENLLNSIWGHDYYGGDRTVDVHVRRLRSKIEDAEHTFLETVRNIGYRFRKNP